MVEKQIEVAVTIEVAHGDAAKSGSEGYTAVGEAPHAIVQQQHRPVAVSGEDQIEVTVAVHVTQHRVIRAQVVRSDTAEVLPPVHKDTRRPALPPALVDPEDVGRALVRDQQIHVAIGVDVTGSDRGHLIGAQRLPGRRESATHVDPHLSARAGSHHEIEVAVTIERGEHDAEPRKAAQPGSP